MEIKDFLSSAQVLIDVPVRDKARLLRELSGRAAQALGLEADLIEAEISRREALGSTGIGDGIAIPHSRIEGLNAPFGVMARLEEPIDFEAIDGEPVDVVFMLLLPTSPQGEQLNALASVARKLRDADVIDKIRTADDPFALYLTMIA